MNPRRLVRRVAFAAPLVLTIAAAPACSHHAKPADPGVTPTNPPRPDQPDVPVAPASPGRWQQVDGRWQFDYDNGDVVYVDDAGGCHLAFNPNCGSGDGDPSTEPPTCNPPPPQDVGCPPGQPSE
ncbi:MAG: hypothetical protein JNK64_09655 [Myxococcales bacterium]|nr:hypothetical protein [Myxococcales bacterium]